MMEARFDKSYEMFKNWKHENNDIVGFCNWQVFEDRFILECWTSVKKGAVIFQIWPDGNGFGEFVEIPRKKVSLALANLDCLIEDYKKHNGEYGEGGKWMPSDTVDEDFIGRTIFVRDTLVKLL